MGCAANQMSCPRELGMEKSFLWLVLTAVLVGLLPTGAAGISLHSVKVTPEGVEYPLIKPKSYPSKGAEPFEMNFGVRRWQKPLTITQDAEHEETVKGSLKWFRKYSGYGVLGHGEDVFTSKAARFRMMHRGQ